MVSRSSILAMCIACPSRSASFPPWGRRNLSQNIFDSFQPLFETRRARRNHFVFFVLFLFSVAKEGLLYLMVSQKGPQGVSSSFRRAPESSAFNELENAWTPIFTGVTAFCESIIFEYPLTGQLELNRQHHPCGHRLASIDAGFESPATNGFQGALFKITFGVGRQDRRPGNMTVGFDQES